MKQVKKGAPQLAVILVGVVILALGCLYSWQLATSLQPINAFWSSDQGVKLLQIQSFIRQRTSLAVAYPGAVYDPEQRFTPLRGQFLQVGERSYGMFSDAFAIASSPFFFLFGYPGLYVLPLAAGLLSLAAIFWIARPLIGAWAALLVVLVSGLASPLWFYSVVFWEHTPALLLLLIAIGLIQRGLDDQRLWRLVVAGGCFALAAWLRNEAVLAVPAALVVLLRMGGPWLQRLLALGGGAAIGMAPLLIYNQITFGAFVGPHVLVHLLAEPAAPATLTPWSVWLAEALQGRQIWFDFLLVPSAPPLIFWPTLLVLGVLGMQALIGQRLQSWPERQQQIWRGGAWIVVAALIVLAFGLQTYRPGQFQTALIVAFPLALVGFLPVAQLPQSPAQRLLWQWSVWFIGLCWLAKLPDGGAQWGPRMLLPTFPLLLIIAVDRLRQWLAIPEARGVAAGLIGATFLLGNVALFSQLAGLRELHAFNQANHTLVSTVAQSDQRVIITDTVYAPYLLAQIYYEDRLIYRVDNGADFEALVTQLAAGGVRSFYYLGRDEQRLRSESAIWGQLVAQEEPTKLPHLLFGTVYRINLVTDR
ncbi:MAG: hypothetical protein Fur005_19650 [Roseiflexaceae bacterium]